MRESFRKFSFIYLFFSGRGEKEGSVYLPYLLEDIVGINLVYRNEGFLNEGIQFEKVLELTKKFGNFPLKPAPIKE